MLVSEHRDAEDHPIQWLVVAGYPLTGKLVALQSADTLEQALAEPFSFESSPDNGPVERLVFQLQAVSYANGTVYQRRD